MGIYNEFDRRLSRTLNRAIETAKGATMNRAAWNETVNDLTAMKRLLEESAGFVAGSLRQAEVAQINAGTLETLAIEQAEDHASAETIRKSHDVFDFNDVGTVKNWLERVRPDVLAEAWSRLDEERRPVLAKAINGRGNS